MDNLLHNLEQRQIDYKILKSTDKQQKWIYVIITCKDDIIESWAQRHGVSLPIDPTNAIKSGRTLPNFALALHTNLESNLYGLNLKSDPSRLSISSTENMSISDGEQKGFHSDTRPKLEQLLTFKDPHGDEEYPLLSKTLWNDIHIRVPPTLTRSQKYSFYPCCMTW